LVGGGLATLDGTINVTAPNCQPVGTTDNVPAPYSPTLFYDDRSRTVDITLG
jgi:hypothetical protein